MTMIPTVYDLSGLGEYDISKLRHDFMRSGATPGGELEAVIDGTESMAVNGSVTAVPYTWGPDGVLERWAILGFNALVADTSTNFDSVHFGQQAPCNNGVIIQVNRSGVLQTFDTIVNNTGWMHLAGADVLYLPFGKAADCLIARVKFDSLHTLILDGTQGDLLQAVVQDDLSGLTAFEMYVWGYKL